MTRGRNPLAPSDDGQLPAYHYSAEHRLHPRWTTCAGTSSAARAIRSSRRRTSTASPAKGRCSATPSPPRRSARRAGPASSPACTPTRTASRDNTDRDARSHQLVTFPRLLHDAGYETAFIGKWHMGVDDSPRPGFDHWVSVKGQGRYVDPELNVDGKPTKRTRLRRPTSSTSRPSSSSRRPHDRSRSCCTCRTRRSIPNLEQRADGSVSDPNAVEVHPGRAAQEPVRRRQPVPRRPNALIDTLRRQAGPDAADRRPAAAGPRDRHQRRRRSATGCGC